VNRARAAHGVGKMRLSRGHGGHGEGMTHWGLGMVFLSRTALAAGFFCGLRVPDAKAEKNRRLAPRR
jgi:hypothetical protein